MHVILEHGVAVYLVVSWFIGCVLYVLSPRLLSARKSIALGEHGDYRVEVACHSTGLSLPIYMIVTYLVIYQKLSDFITSHVC